MNLQYSSYYITDNNCTYHDCVGLNYLGTKSVTPEGHTCDLWILQDGYQFDGGLVEVSIPEWKYDVLHNLFLY